MSISAISPISSKKISPTSLSSIDQGQAPAKSKKPALDQNYHGESLPPSCIFARMMDKVQECVYESAEPAELKHESVGKRIQTTKDNLRKAEKQILDTKKANKTWETKRAIASYIFNGVSILAGTGLVAAGQPLAGGSLIASGVGSSVSDLMRVYGWNSTLTAATSLISGLVGIVGGVAGGIANWKNPTMLLQALNHSAFQDKIQLGISLSSFVAGGFQGYALIEQNQTGQLLSELESLHTKTDTSLQLLSDKYSSAATAFQGSAKGFTDLFKTIAKAHKRYTNDAMRMLTADFPA